MAGLVVVVVAAAAVPLRRPFGWRRGDVGGCGDDDVGRKDEGDEGGSRVRGWGRSGVRWLLLLLSSSPLGRGVATGAAGGGEHGLSVPATGAVHAPDVVFAPP